MDKKTALRIGLLLSEIAMKLDKAAYEKIKGDLEQIEDILVSTIKE